MANETLKRLSDLDVVAEKPATFVSFNDAINGLNPFLLTTMLIDPKEIEFEYNGKAQIKIGTMSHSTTKWGIMSLCKILQIPDPFVKAIPLDLLQTNINRLAKAYVGDLNILLDVNGNVAGVTKPCYRPIRTIDMLPRLGDKFKSIDNLKIEMNIRNMILSLTQPIGTMEPKVGDITRCGLEISNSELNDLDAKGNIFLLRLVCTNGAVLTDNWGRVARNKNNRIQYETVVDQFVNGCSMLNTNREALATVYNQLPNILLDTKQFVGAYKALHPVLGKDAAEKILQSNAEETKDWLDFEKKRTHWSSTQSEWYGLIPRSTEKNAYEVFNNITQTARDLSSRDISRRLRVYSGKYLWMLSQDIITKLN